MERKIKTFDGEIVANEQIDCVAMILANCSETRMNLLGIREKFQTFAERFVSVLTQEEINEFIAHNVIIKIKL